MLCDDFFGVTFFITLSTVSGYFNYLDDCSTFCYVYLIDLPAWAPPTRPWDLPTIFATGLGSPPRFFLGWASIDEYFC